MKKIVFDVTIISLILFFVQSCSIDENVTTTAATVSKSSTDYIGTYLSACGENKQQVKVVITDSGTEDVAYANFYKISHSDSACSTVLKTIQYNHTAGAMGDTTDDNGNSVSKIYLVTVNVTATLNTSYTSSANEASWCGISDWEAGTAKDVTGKDCTDSLSESFSPALTTKYDIWYLNGTSFQKSAESTGGYPTTLDGTYTKQ